MICRNRTGFKNSHLSVFMPIRRKNIIHFSTHFLVIVCFVFERREFFHPERRNIERFHQFKCLFIKAVRFFISTEKYIQNCFAIFMGNCEISSVIWIANDLSTSYSHLLLHLYHRSAGKLWNLNLIERSQIFLRGRDRYPQLEFGKLLP